MFDLLLIPFVNSIKAKMLFRGAISYGSYYLSTRLIIGPALDEAAYHHDKLNWIGISLTPKLAKDMNRTNPRTANASWYENVPHKEGNYRSIVLNWPDYDTDKECLSTLQSEYQHSPNGTKYENTFKFYGA